MGDEIDADVQYDKGNQYERLSTQTLNREILGSDHKRSIDIEAPERLLMTEDQRCRMREIIQKCNGHATDWGFKDPRTALLYPLWAQELPEHKIICIYRPLDELWLRYRPKGLRSKYRNIGVAYKLVKRWCEHNERIVQYLKDPSIKGLLLEYSRMMVVDGEFDRLQDFVALPLVDQRKPGLYRNKAQRRSLVLRLGVWWAQKFVGAQPDRIASDLERLRELT